MDTCGYLALNREVNPELLVLAPSWIRTRRLTRRPEIRAREFESFLVTRSWALTWNSDSESDTQADSKPGLGSCTRTLIRIQTLSRILESDADSDPGLGQTRCRTRTLTRIPESDTASDPGGGFGTARHEPPLGLTRRNRPESESYPAASAPLQT